MAKYDMSPHIQNFDDFVGWIFMETITREAKEHTGDGSKIFKHFPDLSAAHKAGEVDISLTIQGVEVDFVDVMNQVYKQYLRSLAEDSKELAKSLISKELSAKVDLIKEMLDEVEDKIAEEIPEERLAEIREYYEEGE